MFPSFELLELILDIVTSNKTKTISSCKQQPPIHIMGSNPNTVLA